jgi:cobalt/nickel transport system permease protein
MKLTLMKKGIVPEWNPVEVIGAGAGHNGFGTSVFKDIDARILLSAAFVTIVALAAVKRWYVLDAVFAVIFLITIGATPSRKSYLTKLMYPLIIAVLLFIVQSYTYGSTVALTAVFPVYNEGIASGWLIFNRVLASVSILLLLVESTSPEKLIESLSWFKVPIEIRNMVSLMFRYTSVLKEEFVTMFNAQKSRLGYSTKLSWIKKLKNIAIIGGMLLVRSYDRSNKVIMSMMARGYTQNIDIVRTFVRFTRKDYLFAALSLVLIVCIMLVGVM